MGGGGGGREKERGRSGRRKIHEGLRAKLEAQCLQGHQARGKIPNVRERE